MSHATSVQPPIYGMVAEFETPEDLVEATKAARKAGYRKMDAYTPFPVHGLYEPEALNLHDWRLPWVIFLAGVSGAIGGMALQWYIAVVDYPMNIGGKPAFSWPQFIPVTFECTILFAALTAAGAMIALNGLPRPHHPIFNAPRFDLASQSRFFLCIEAIDPKFDREETAEFLLGLNPHTVSEVEN